MPNGTTKLQTSTLAPSGNSRHESSIQNYGRKIIFRRKRDYFIGSIRIYGSKQ